MRNRRNWIFMIIPAAMIFVAVLILQFVPRQVIPDVDLPEGSLLAVDWSPSGDVVAVGKPDGTVDLIHPDTRELIRTLQAGRGSGYTTAVAFSPDGRQVAAVDDLAYARIWDVETGIIQRALRGRGEQQLSDLAWSPDGTFLLTINLFESIVEIWDAETGELQVSNMQFGYLYSVDWMQFGNLSRIAIGLSTRGVITVEQESARPLDSFAPGNLSVEVMSVAWSPDGERLAGGGHDGKIYIWNAGSNEVINILDAHQYYVVGLAWSPDGRTLASASFDGTVRLWDMTGIGTLLDTVVFGEGMREIAWSSDSERYVVVGSINSPNRGIEFGKRP